MDQNGFANILLISILPFLVGIFLLTFVCAGVIQMEMQMNHIVRKAQIEAQKKARASIEKLMSKNSLASALKTDYDITYAAYVITPPPEKSALKLQLDRIMLQRRTLDIEQKVIIQEANLRLLGASQNTYQRLEFEGREQANKLNILLSVTFRANPPGRTYLAVEPTSSDVAPVYRTKTGFSKRQALEQSWQYGLRMKSPLTNFLTAGADFKRSSKISLYEAGAGWDIEIGRDKFLSKPWFSLPF